MSSSTRKRSNSVNQALSIFPDPTQLSAPNTPPTPSLEVEATSSTVSNTLPNKLEIKKSNSEQSNSFLKYIITFRWMTNPVSSFKIIFLILTTYTFFELFPSFTTTNPIRPLVFISYPFTPLEGESTSRFDKGVLDVAFLGFYIIVFSFLRQVITEMGVRPLGVRLGIRGRSKSARFNEQGYAFCYFLCSSILGLYVMTGQDSWWYNVKVYWMEYPRVRMEGPLKVYYLLQFAYWCQQMLVLVLRIEKPRSDIYELIIHHLVTLWLVGWSYALNFTIIGTAVFVSMDVPDVCLALSKCLNYLELQRTSEISFVFFMAVWHYMRHYLNIKILFSIYYDLNAMLPPFIERTWVSSNPSYPRLPYIPFGVGSGLLPSWIMEGMFISVLLLQLVNVFWTALIWNVLFKMLCKEGLVDVREEGENEKED